MKNKIDLLVSFDTTGSMYPVLAQVRREVEQFVKNMFTEFKDLRLGVIAHGDYCDKDNPYTIRVKDFTRDEVGLCRFIRDTKSTYGGDADECYELVLHTAYSDLTWREDAERVLIMIGDASPHSPSYKDNYLKLDWKEEAEELRKQGIKVFSVHALAGYRSSSKAFYKHVAETTGGIYLTLDMFNEIVDLIKATCYQQGGEEKLNEYVTIIRDNGRMTRSMENNIKRLRGEEVEDTYETYKTSRSSYKSRAKASDDVTLKTMDKLVPVMPGRFQTFTVPENVDIKGFVNSMGITFKKGRGFYELSKAETVQQYKEVIIQDRETGEMFNGSQVREELGLQPQTESGGVKERLHKSATDKFRVFVQSTSVNRKLIAGTTFLYEVDDIEDTGTIIEDTPASDTYVDKTEKKVKKTKKKEDKPVDIKIESIEKGEVITELDLDKTVEEAVEEVIIEVELGVKPGKKARKATKSKAKTTKEVESTSTSEEKAKPVAEPVTEITADVMEAGRFFDMKEVDKTVRKSKPKKTTNAEPVKEEIKTDRVKSQLAKVEEALSRFDTSSNKKNTTFLINNLKKLRDEADKVLAELYK